MRNNSAYLHNQKVEQINYYILVDENPAPTSKEEWEKFKLKPNQRLVRVDKFKNLEISTYFSGISKGHHKSKLFETHIENFEDNSLRKISHSLKWKDAEAVHIEIYNELNPSLKVTKNLKSLSTQLK